MIKLKIRDLKVSFKYLSYIHSVDYFEFNIMFSNGLIERTWLNPYNPHESVYRLFTYEEVEKIRSIMYKELERVKNAIGGDMNV